MQLKTMLNRIQKHSSFVYDTVRLVEHPRLTLEVRVRPRVGARARCGRCRRRAPGSAHGRGRRAYRLQARHARLAVHASHTLVAFFIETWDERKRKAIA